MEDKDLYAKDNGEKTQATAETAEAEKEESAAAGLGKFKDTAALLAAYESLEAEFTRRSQRLKELESKNKAQEVSQGDAPFCGGDEKELIKAALSDEKVRKAVVEDYLKNLASDKGAPIMTAGIAAPAPSAAPKSIKEAGVMAAKFFKN